MSLLYMSGFEGAPKAREVGTSGVTYAAGGRTGQCMVIPGAHNCVIALPSPKNEIVVGVALRPLAGYDPGQSIRLILGEPADRFTVSLGTANGNIAVVRHDQYGAVNVGNAPGMWTPDKYVYLEIHVKSDPTNGFFRLRADGVEVINLVGVTQNTGNATPVLFSAVTIVGPAANWAGTVHVDDLYILDGADATTGQGRSFNAPLGTPRIEPLALIASGPTNQWVGSDGNSVDNHLLVDEVPPSSTDYVESSVVGDRELYDFSAPTLSGEVLAVDVSAYSSSPDGGTNPVKTVVRSSGGTSSVGVGAVPPSGTNYKSITDGPRTKDPDGNLWTKTAVGDATYGVEVG